MYRRILKKDLKRKKTMNAILLLFVILSAAFAASSANNIFSVLGGIDGYFDKAGVTDYVIITRDRGDDKAIKDILADDPSVEGYECERALVFPSETTKLNGMQTAVHRWCLTMDIGNTALNFFDKNNEKVTDVKRGEAYVTTPMKNVGGAEIGDTISFCVGDVEYSYRISGVAKDAVGGAALMNVPRILLNSEDYREIVSDNEQSKELASAVYYIKTGDVSSLKTAVASAPNAGVIFDGDRRMLKTAYIMNTIVSILLIVVSACLLIVSFVVLRFTIGFTIAEEFREIGVMKAIGLKNSSIRLLYIVKYAAIAVVGTTIGLIASFPLGKLLLDAASADLVLESCNPTAIALACGLAVVLLILWFGWSSTAKIKKLSPIDAVRSGQTGERFRKKRGLRIGKSRLGPAGFLAANDVASSPKSYLVIVSVFTVCVLLVSVVGTAAKTLCSRKITSLFGVIESDVYIDDSPNMFDFMTGKKTLEEVVGGTEDKLAELGYPAKARVELFYKASVVNGDKRMLLHLMQCKETDAADYEYAEGKAPARADEIALTYACAENLGVGLGDKVVIDTGNSQDEYVVTALYYAMIQMGEAGRLHQTADLPREFVSSYFEIQADFTDSPSDAEIERRIEKLKDVYGKENVLDADEFVRISAGVADIFEGLDKFVMAMSVIIIVMITILMERSFIEKEKSEIALMKAIGFGNSAIIAQHVLRFVIVGVIATAIGAALSYPAMQLVGDPIFRLVGAGCNVSYDMSPADILLKRPLIILAATVAGAFFTALYARTIKSSDAADIE